MRNQLFWGLMSKCALLIIPFISLYQLIICKSDQLESCSKVQFWVTNLFLSSLCYHNHICYQFFPHFTVNFFFSKPHSNSLTFYITIELAIFNVAFSTFLSLYHFSTSPNFQYSSVKWPRRMRQWRQSTVRSNCSISRSSGMENGFRRDKSASGLPVDKRAWVYWLKITKISVFVARPKKKWNFENFSYL